MAPVSWRAERSGARLASGTTEVLGFIALDFKEFLGSPILLLGLPRISIRILSGFRFRFGFGFGFGLILVGFGLICFGFRSIIAFIALIALLGGPKTFQVAFVGAP